jgi:hypothetical protein
MTIEELTPEAIAILKSVVIAPRAIEESPTLQLMFVDRLVMGTPDKVVCTAEGKRLLARWQAMQD